MEAIRAIQEIIDENKEEMPTGVVTRVMDECQWLKQPMPYIINYPDYRELIIVHSIVPYEPRKRARDEA